MVTDVDIYQKLVNTNHREGMVVEIVGVAGAGKTSLFRELQRRNYPTLLCGYHPEVWKISSYPFYLKNIFQLLPTFTRVYANSNRFLKRREIAFMCVLYGWADYLDKLIKHTHKTFIVDQGAISLMAYLKIWGTKGLYKNNMYEWWETIYRKWSKGIDLVILIDASDDVLISRINHRPQDHFLKGESNQLSQYWTEKYRALYEEILNHLASLDDNFHIIRINSDNSTVDEIASIIIPELLQVNKK
jgi:thymidylate kinase